MARTTLPSDDSSPSEASDTEQKSNTVCFLCRQRKTKCDRAVPSCGFCLKAKVDCKYVPNLKKRGLRAGYVSQLESRLDKLETELASLRNENATLAASHPVQTPLSTVHAASVGETPSSSLPPQIQAPSWVPSTPSKRQRLNQESDAAVKDLMTLPRAFMYTLAETWFKENHIWCPMLSYDHIMEAVANLPTPIDYIEDVELRAVLALELSYATQAICLGYHGRWRLSQYLRSQVLADAISQPSLSSVRALIILGLMDYGQDNIASTFSLMSVCRRTCEHLGLFQKLLSQIEGESPAQVGPPPADTSGGDAHMISVTWGTLALDAVSTLGVSWRDVSAALVDHLASIAYVSTPYLRDSYRAHMHLAAIGLQPVHHFLHDLHRSPPLHPLPPDSPILLKCDEIHTNLMGYIHSHPRTSYTILENGLVDFDPNLIHTEVVVYSTIIIIYQPLIDFATSSPSIALSRCLHVCNEAMVTLIRSISDADAELNTPLLANFFFVAARFKLVMCRERGGDEGELSCRDVPFDTLMHAINMCGRRWRVAKRLDMVLRGAVAELEGSVRGDGGGGSGRKLPKDFWDLKRSHLDISEELKAWEAESRGVSMEGSLVGPYTWLLDR